MEMKNITENQIVDNVVLRDKMIDRVDVLDKVKELFLIPQLECLTIKQVAEYYEVDLDTIKKCYQRNMGEIDLDGVRNETPKTIKEFFNGTYCPLKDFEQLHGRLVMQIDDNTTMVIPNRGIKMFPKRAILRIGMLLRDSEVAKEVRTQLLNAFDQTQKHNPDLLTKDIDDEKTLLLNIASAYSSGDLFGLMQASMILDQFQKRHINELQEQNDKLANDNKLLSGEIIKLPMRSKINRMVRVLSSELNMDFAELWSIIYKQLKYKYGINLKMRGERKRPYIQYLQEGEYKKFQAIISSLLLKNGLSPDEFFTRCKIID